MLLSKITLSIMTQIRSFKLNRTISNAATTLTIKTFSISTLSITVNNECCMLTVAFKPIIQVECRYAESRYTESHNVD